MKDYHIKDFTIPNYRRLLKILSDRYHCLLFDEFPFDMPENGCYCLWRHDVDFSIERALIMAENESGFGIKANYFIQLSSNFYNVFDPEIKQKIRLIMQSGHAVGLHFSPQPYAISTKSHLLDRLAFEKQILENLLDCEISSFSFHNPAPEMLEYRDMKLSGMMNVYADYIQKNFTYCSDSNGYWRFQRLGEVLNDHNPRLHVLTHPVWWQDEPMHPRDRVVSQIKHSGDNLLHWYDDILSKFNRKNIGLKNGE